MIIKGKTGFLLAWERRFRLAIIKKKAALTKEPPWGKPEIFFRLT
jgi:hypothetical protein